MHRTLMFEPIPLTPRFTNWCRNHPNIDPNFLMVIIIASLGIYSDEFSIYDDIAATWEDLDPETHMDIYYEATDLGPYVSNYINANTPYHYLYFTDIHEIELSPEVMVVRGYLTMEGFQQYVADIQQGLRYNKDHYRRFAGVVTRCG